MANFWWNSGKGKNIMQWVSWKKLTEKKTKGGMGFKDLKHFNEALLAKQVWRLITCPNLLVSRILKAKYLNNKSLFNSEVPKSASWIWQSIMSTRKMEDRGLMKRIGNGKNTVIWTDKWIQGSGNGKVLTPRPADSNLKLVADLIEDFRWNRKKVLDTFCVEDSQKILGTPISLAGREDTAFWTASKSGIYTVQSGYEVSIQLDRNEQQENRRREGTSREAAQGSMWKFFWGLNIKFKLKHFLWKCLSGGLPTNESFCRRTGKQEPWCKSCGEGVETVEHIFFFCKKAEKIWKFSPVQWDGLKELRWRFWDWWWGVKEEKNRQQGEDHICLTVNIIWMIWKERNNFQFKGKRKHFTQIVNQAWMEWEEYERVKKITNGTNNDQTTKARQDSTEEGSEARNDVIRISTAVGKKQINNKSGFGLVSTDEAGRIKAAWAMSDYLAGNQEMAEAEAVKLALIKAKMEGWRKVEVVISNRRLVQKLQSKNAIAGTLTTILEDTLELARMFEFCSFLFGKQSIFAESNRIANLALKFVHDMVWRPVIPV